MVFIYHILTHKHACTYKNIVVHYVWVMPEPIEFSLVLYTYYPVQVFCQMLFLPQYLSIQLDILRQHSQSN